MQVGTYMKLIFKLVNLYHANYLVFFYHACFIKALNKIQECFITIHYVFFQQKFKIMGEKYLHIHSKCV